MSDIAFLKRSNFPTVRAFCHCPTFIVFSCCFLSLNFPSDRKFSDCCIFLMFLHMLQIHLRRNFSFRERLKLSDWANRKSSNHSQHWSSDLKLACSVSWRTQLYFKSDYSLLSSLSNSTEIVKGPWPIGIDGFSGGCREAPQNAFAPLDKSAIFS